MRSAYDFIVVGGGSAGFNAARVAASLGRRVAVIDGARKLGGLCILRGCMPSKTLIYTAEVLHLATGAAKLGLNVRGASANMRSVHARKSRIISDFANHRVKQLETGDFDLVHGLSESSFWTSDDVLDLDFKPRSVIVLGGGIVACELAQFLRRIGTRVCLLQRNRALMRHLPVAASKIARQAFEDEGIEVRTRTKILGIRSGPGGTTVTFRQDGKTHKRKADHLLNALGREPNTFGLSLGDAGVKTTPDGQIITNRWQQTSAPNIYAAGDCCGPHEIVHVAVQQGELAARHAAKVKGLRPVEDSMLLVVVFTDPQLATIGWQERDLKRKRIKFLAATYPFDDHGKAILMNATYGYVKVLADPRGGRILGAEIVGKDAGELIHCFSTPLAMRATVHDMLRAPWYHPTLAEIITYPLEELAERTGK
jgi:pyruvate/2-oxoglutarate dehydrogenase complex dihydrolipoamide dehydrogenase (E3) component